LPEAADAAIANVDGGSGNQVFHFFVVFEAERTLKPQLSGREWVLLLICKNLFGDFNALVANNGGVRTGKEL
jgi:hypothetical protein